MQIGKLDQLVTLQSLSTSNTSGSITNSYTTVASVWAMIISERGSEALESARVNAKQSIRVLIRYRVDVDVKWRILWMGKAFNITSVDRSERRKGELWVTCQSVGYV